MSGFFLCQNRMIPDNHESTVGDMVFRNRTFRKATNPPGVKR